MVYKKSVLFTPLGYNSINFKVLNKFKDNLIDYCKQRNCQYFLAIQYMAEETNKPCIGEEMPDGFITENILEQKLEDGFYLKISKCYPK